jgi:hypothetical protein
MSGFMEALYQIRFTLTGIAHLAGHRRVRRAEAIQSSGVSVKKSELPLGRSL